MSIDELYNYYREQLAIYQKQAFMTAVKPELDRMQRRINALESELEKIENSGLRHDRDHEEILYLTSRR